MSKGLINEILNNIADLTNLQTGEVELDIGTLIVSGRLTSATAQLGWIIPLGRVLPKGTTVTKVTGNIVVRAGNHNSTGIYIWKQNSTQPMPFDTSVNSIFSDGANATQTILPSYWNLSIQGESNLYMQVISGTSYFFSGNSTNNGYLNNQPCVVELREVKVTVDIPTNSIYVPQATITLDAPNTTVVNNGSPIPGTIQMYAGSIAPEGFLICDGSAINRIDYSVLFSIIGQTYGAGDGITTFNIPDLRGRVPLGVGTGTAEDATAHTLGDQNGAETHSLTTGQLPNIHGEAKMGWSDSSAAGIMITGNSGVFSVKSGTTYFTPSTKSGSYNSTLVLNVGSNQAHNNMQPYLAINYIIATGKND